MSDGTEPAEEQLDKLMQELRVALPGVQVLLAFLLTVPFNSRFTELDASERQIFFFGVIAAAAASILMIAPSAHHRFIWPTSKADLERLLTIGTWEARAGIVALGLSIVASVYVVAEVVLGGATALVAGVILAVAIAGLWVVLPLVLRGARRGAPALDRDL
jgi:hypothetical protein